MLFARVPLLDGIATITANVCKDIMVVENCAIQSTHANTTTVMSMPIVSQMPKLSTKTVMNVSAKMVSRVTDTSATFTSHHVTVSFAVTMKSDKLSVTNMVPKHVSADVLKVSRTATMVVLQWDHATTIIVILKLHVFPLELHTLKDSLANVMMDSKVMVLTNVVPLTHVQTVTLTLNVKQCQVTVVPMSKNAFARPHTLVMVSAAEWALHVHQIVQEDLSAGTDNVDVSFAQFPKNIVMEKYPFLGKHIFSKKFIKNFRRSQWLLVQRAILQVRR